MASMRNWLHPELEDEKHLSGGKKRRVAVVHCKAGKGRSGTVASSYLISQEGWKREDALRRFTERRMRAGFGEGVSIPSQVRYVGYVDRWTNSMNKQFVERPVEVLELHVWDLRDGVKVSIEGYIENGQQIKTFHTFTRDEKVIEEEGKVTKQQVSTSGSSSNAANGDVKSSVMPESEAKANTAFSFGSSTSLNISTVLFKPSIPLILPTSDINIDFERRNTAQYTGFTMVTSLAHVWFNTYFEGGHEGADSGVFEIDWEAMDGIKGSAKKGIKALEKLKLVWRYAPQTDALAKVITEPARGEHIFEPEAADWKHGSKDETAEAQAKKADGVTSGRPGGAALTMGATIAVGAESLGKELGLRKEHPDSANISRASSAVNVADAKPAGKSAELAEAEQVEGSEDGSEGVKVSGPEGEDRIQFNGQKDGADDEGIEGRQDTSVGHHFENGMGKLAHMVKKVKGDDKHDDESTKT